MILRRLYAQLEQLFGWCPDGKSLNLSNTYFAKNKKHDSKTVLKTHKM